MHKRWTEMPHPSLITFLMVRTLSPVVNECRRLLTVAGFKELREAEHWEIKPLEKVQ